MFEGRNKTNISRDIEVWEEAALLNHVTGPAPQTNRIPLARRLSLNPYLAGGGRQKTVDEFESGSLAATGLAQQYESFTLLH